MRPPRALRAALCVAATTVVACAATTGGAQAASGAGVVQVVAAGKVLASSPALAGWAYPDDGTAVQVADAEVPAGGAALRLTGISLLGGRLTIGSAVVGTDGGVFDVAVDGEPVGVAGANAILAVPGAGWAILSQHASLPLADGTLRETRVAVRLHLTVATAGLPAGADLIVGFAAGGAPVDRQSALTGARADIPADLVPLYRAAGKRYGVPWSVLAAIGKVESNHGRSDLAGVKDGVNFLGCCAGPMQFSIGTNGYYDTWGAYGVDGDGDGRKTVYDAADAIPAAANMLAANGAENDLRGAVFLYNRSQTYVDDVLAIAASYADGDDELPAAATAAAADSRDDTPGFFSPVLLW